MRKKLLTATLTILMVFSLAACGGNQKGSDEADVTKTVEEETSVEKTVEEPVTEESVIEEPAVEETNTTEYQLTQMDSGFYGGIAWATVSGDAGTKHVLINKELQVVYEVPDGMEIGDIFGGKAVVLPSDQTSNPGFMIIGSDGTVLYECTDNLGGSPDSFTGYPYNINFTRDGCTIYEKNESGMTGNKVTACILNDKFDTVAEIEISSKDFEQGIGSAWVMVPRVYVYLSEGVYGSYACYNEHVNQAYSLLNVKEQTAVEIICQFSSPLTIDQDMDRCAGLRAQDGYKDNYESWVAVNGEAIDYSGVTDRNILIDLVKANGKTYTVGGLGTQACFNHGYIMYNEADYGTNIDNIEGFVLPDFGVPINNFRLSNDGKYAALGFQGADGNYYGTVISSEGQKMYEPVVTGQLEWRNCVCDGYIFKDDGTGLTPDGKEFQLGDGTVLSGIGENSTAYTPYTSEQGNRVGDFLLSDGYIVCEGKLYRLDGTEVTTVTAVN